MPAAVLLHPPFVLYWLGASWTHPVAQPVRVEPALSCLNHDSDCFPAKGLILWARCSVLSFDLWSDLLSVMF